MSEPNPLRVLQLIDQAEVLADHLDTTPAAVLDALGLAGLTLIGADAHEHPGVHTGTSQRVAGRALVLMLRCVDVECTWPQLAAALLDYALRLAEPATEDECNARTAAYLSCGDAA